MSLPVTWTVKVDWDNNGNFTGSEDDITEDVSRLRITFGRASALDEIQPARCEIVLDNASRKYSRYNSSSAIYGLMLAGRPVLVEATHDSITYPQFLGELIDLGESYPGGVPSATLSALDGVEFLRRADQVRTSVFEGYRVDENLDELLDAAGWPIGRRDHDTAVVTLPYWWSHREPSHSAAMKLARNELGGMWYINRAGDSRFENRDYRPGAAIYATITDATALNLAFRQGDLIDRVEIERGGLSEDSAATAVYTLSPGGREIMPGTTDPRNRISFTWVGAKSAVQPVAVTDYTANSAADGSGTDKTAQLVVDSFTAYGGGGEIVFENLDASPIYIVGAITLRVRGIAIRRSNEDRLVTADAPSPLVTGQPLRRVLEWNDDIDEVLAYAQYLAAVLSQDQPRLVLPLVGHTDAEIATILGLDVSKRIELQLTTGLYPPGMSGEYYVEGATVEVANDFSDMTAMVTVWSRDQAMGNGFRVSSDDASAEYSAIVTDGATVGDRIWF